MPYPKISTIELESGAGEDHTKLMNDLIKQEKTLSALKRLSEISQEKPPKRK